VKKSVKTVEPAKSNSRKTYVLRVEVEYEGRYPKPRQHRVRKWLLDCILLSDRAPVNVWRTGNVVGNSVGMSVRCAGHYAGTPPKTVKKVMGRRSKP
jgi:hypothetical protein